MNPVNGNGHRYTCHMKGGMSEDSDPRRFGPGPSSDFREDSAQQVRRFGPEGEMIRPRLYYIVFLSKNT